MEKIEKAMNKAIEWLDKNQLAKMDELEDKQKLEGLCNPIIANKYQSNKADDVRPKGDKKLGRDYGGSGDCNNGAGPKIEEVDQIKDLIFFFWTSVYTF